MVYLCCIRLRNRSSKTNQVRFKRCARIDLCMSATQEEGGASMSHSDTFFLYLHFQFRKEKRKKKKKEGGGGLASRLRTSCFGPHVKINQGPGQWTGGSRRSDWRAGFLLLRRSCNSPSPSNPFCIAIAWLFSPSLCCGRALPCCRFLRCCRRGTIHGSQALCREIK